jgi:hypothetical protein
MSASNAQKPVDPAFLALPGAREAIAAGVTLKLHSDEQSPASFNPQSSRYLPPYGFVPTSGKPYYHVPADNVNPTDRSNHQRAAYRAYADVKYSYLHAGQWPAWVWWTIGIAAVGAGLAFALRRPKKIGAPRHG